MLWSCEVMATSKLCSHKETRWTWKTLLRQLRVNFLQWLIKDMNIHGGSRIIAENNEIHLMKNQNLLIHPLQLNIFWSTHYNSKLHNNSTRYNSKLHNDFKYHFLKALWGSRISHQEIPRARTTLRSSWSNFQVYVMWHFCSRPFYKHSGCISKPDHCLGVIMSCDSSHKEYRVQVGHG